MKILMKQEFRKITFNHLLDIEYEDFMSLYEKCTAKPCSCLVFDIILASNIPLSFRKSLLGRI